MGNYTPILFMTQPIYDSTHPFAIPRHEYNLDFEVRCNVMSITF